MLELFSHELAYVVIDVPNNNALVCFFYYAFQSYKGINECEFLYIEKNKQNVTQKAPYTILTPESTHLFI